MSDRQESIANIVAAMRILGKLDEESTLVGFCLRTYADRIEAAWKRESKAIATEHAVLPATGITKGGDAAAMREALSALIPVAEHGLNARTHSLNCTVGATNVEAARALVKQAKEAIADAKAALAKPPRNCDVGTAEEQTERWWKFCEKHFILSLVKDNCAKCPIRGTNRHCELAWAQLPYEEGGAK